MNSTENFVLNITVEVLDLFVDLFIAFFREGWGVHDCLQKQSESDLSPECISFIKLHGACREDLDRKCPGNAYTNDAIGTDMCLTPIPNVFDFYFTSLFD